VLDGNPILKGKGRGIWRNVAAHFKEEGHSTVSCAKTAEPIEIPFWMKTWVDRRNHVLDGVQIFQGEGAILVDCPGHSKALAIFAALVVVAVAAKGIIQSLITFTSRRDHSVCQASANGILKISGRRRCGGLSAANGFVGLHSASEV